jgi:hypothetical protein
MLCMRSPRLPNTQTLQTPRPPLLLLQMTCDSLTRLLAAAAALGWTPPSALRTVAPADQLTRLQLQA